MLSVLIVNWNTKDLLRSCLASILKFPPYCDYEVIVVDNDSSDGSATMVSNEFPWVKLIESGSNIGYSAGNNIAIKASKGDYLLTLNPDTEFFDDSLTKSLLELIDKEKFGVLGLRLIGPDKNTQKSVRGFPTLVGVFGSFTKLDKLFPKSPFGSYSVPTFDYSVSQPAAQPMGTFLLIKRTSLQTLEVPEKPFDEQFPIFFNEVDLLFRLDQAGWPSWFFAEGAVFHHHGASTKQVRKSMIWESHRSLVRYFEKHLKGASRAALPFVKAAAWVAALIRAKGTHAGFGTQRHNM